MDRSFLSAPAVVEASRAFVCVRLMTYENKEEMAFLKTFGAGRSGEVENTVFCFLAPDGKRLLTKATREPRSSVQQLTDSMARIAKEFPGKQIDGELPLVANLRLAVNVAACDRQPLIVIRSDDAAARKKLENALAALAWSPEFIGQFVFVSIGAGNGTEWIEGALPGSSVIVALLDRYGLKGKTLQQIDGDASPRRLAETLRKSLAGVQKLERNFKQHVMEGHRQGVFWETLTPVTDPMELRAREKGKKKGASE